MQGQEQRDRSNVHLDCEHWGLGVGSREEGGGSEKAEEDLRIENEDAVQLELELGQAAGHSFMVNHELGCSSALL